MQVGYISEYPHTGVESAAAVEQGVGLHDLFWGGRNIELEDGKKVFGQVWPKVGIKDDIMRISIVWLLVASGCSSTLERMRVFDLVWLCCCGCIIAGCHSHTALQAQGVPAV